MFLFVKLTNLCLLLSSREVHEEYKDVVLKIHRRTLFNCKLKFSVFTTLKGNHTPRLFLQLPKGTSERIENFSSSASTCDKNPILKSPIPHGEEAWFPVSEANRDRYRFVLFHCAFASYNKPICLFLGFFLL